MIDELIKLSKIFKEGFTVEIKEGKLNQYNNYSKPFIVSYLTVIEVRTDKTLYNNVQHIPNNCIIGGWLDLDTNTYYIELNKTFESKTEAMQFAKAYNQKAIYDIRTGKVIEV